MKIRFRIAAAFLAAGMSLAMVSVAMAGVAPKNGKGSSVPAAGASSTQDENMHLEGEKRFRSNCARCHLAPPKFPPRMMATIVRHMRVRANITDEDTRLILRYMTE